MLALQENRKLFDAYLDVYILFIFRRDDLMNYIYLLSSQLVHGRSHLVTSNRMQKQKRTSGEPPGTTGNGRVGSSQTCFPWLQGVSHDLEVTAMNFFPVVT